MSIGIICLANGPYSIFIDNLIESCEQHFLLNHKKQFFIITDNEFSNKNKENVTTIYKKRNGWPLDCLLRSQYSYELKDKTSHLSHVYFFNANMSFYSTIDENILPDKSGLVGVEHACYVHRNNNLFTYDRNPSTHAYIPYDQGKIYYQACLWGGTTEKFMCLSETIMNWTNVDIQNKTEPIWLDQSYLNKYFLTNPPKTLSPFYAWPTHMSGYNDISNLKILQLQKKDYIKQENFQYIE